VSRGVVVSVRVGSRFEGDAATSVRTKTVKGIRKNILHEGSGRRLFFSPFPGVYPGEAFTP